MKKKLIIALVLVIVLAIVGYNYLYKPHRNISEETATYTLQSMELITQFETDVDLYQQHYLNKTIEIKGSISEINPTTVTLNEFIFCSMLPDFDANKYKTNTSVTLKGRFIGYDDLLGEIKLDQCTITN